MDRYTNKRQTVCMVVSRAYQEDPRVLKEAVSLTRAGLRVFVWTWQRDSRPSDSRWGEYSTNEVRIHCPRGSILRLMVTFPIFWITAAIRISLIHPSVIHCHDLDTVPVGIILKISTHPKLVFDAHEIYSEMVRNVLPRSMTRWLSSVESFATKLCDLLVIASEERRPLYRRFDRIIVVPNTPSVSFSRPPTESVAEEVFYGGALTPDKGLMEIMNAVSSLVGVDLIIAGYGPLEDLINERSRSSRGVRFLGVLSREALFERLSRSATSIALYRPSNLNNIYAASNKLFEAMMLGVPLITNRECACARIVERENCGLLVPYGDVAALAGAIEKIVHNASFRKILAQNGYEAFIARYAWERYEPQFVRAYLELASGGLNTLATLTDRASIL